MKQATTVDIYSQNQVTLNKINDKLSSAIADGRRSEFSLLLAMSSGDFYNTLNAEDKTQSFDDSLSTTLQPPAPIRLVAEEKDYRLGNNQTIAFHQAGLASVYLNHYLTPCALHFSAFNTQNLGEDLYHNLSLHERQSLIQNQPKSQSKTELTSLLVSER